MYYYFINLTFLILWKIHATKQRTTKPTVEVGVDLCSMHVTMLTYMGDVTIKNTISTTHF